MKLSYGIENLRSFGEMEPVELRPITVLVGANSSGKSTFLRSIALLRQTLQENMEEPLLWYKKDSVDFGDFTTAVRNNETDRKIRFRFTFQELPIREIDRNNKLHIALGFSEKNKLINRVCYDIGIMKSGDKVSIGSIGVTVTDCGLSFKAEYSKMKISYYLNENIIDNKILNGINILDKLFYYTDYENIYPYTNHNKFSQNIYDSIIELLDISQHESEMKDEADKIVFAFPMCEDALNKLQNNTKNNEIIKIYELIKNNKNLIDYIKINCSLNYIFKIISCMNKKLQLFFLHSNWVGPARNLNERYHRIQGLDVSEIWADGRNLPMYLHELDRNRKLSEFSNWVNELIGYRVEIKNQPPNVEICMVKDDSKVNLIDTGYGVSQILPILAQIWMNTIGNSLKWSRMQPLHVTRDELRPVMMEQPELHLHPIHQAQIADALASTRKLNYDDIGEPRVLFIVETHSEAFISKLSALIRKKEMNPDEVQVVVFSKATNKTNTTEVTVSTFDEEGRLGNWPYGFFNYRP